MGARPADMMSFVIRAEEVHLTKPENIQGQPKRGDLS